MKPLLLSLTLFLQPVVAGQPATTETELRDAVQTTEALAQNLRVSLQTYRKHLISALFRLGYPPTHPIFCTKLDGLSETQIDLDALDEYKMGQFAFDLVSQGTRLTPDPFVDWARVQTFLDAYAKTTSAARKVVTHAGIVDVDSPSNIPSDTFRKLQNRWRSAIRRAGDSYDYAKAVAAVRYENGEMLSAPLTLRHTSDTGAFTLACGFGMCSNK